MQILHDQLRGQERVLFASAQALLCGLALYMAHAAYRSSCWTREIPPT